MDTTYPVITQTYTPEETSRISGAREVLPQVSFFKTIELYVPPESTFNVTPIVYKQGALVTGSISKRRYTPATTTVNDFIFQSWQGEEADTITYATMAIYANSSTVSQTRYTASDPLYKRDVLFQIYSSRLNGTLREGGAQFSLTGKSATFYVKITNSDGGGYMGLPKLAADPTAIAGLIYYNTATSKVRICEGSTWKDVV